MDIDVSEYEDLYFTLHGLIKFFDRYADSKGNVYCFAAANNNKAFIDTAASYFYILMNLIEHIHPIDTTFERSAAQNARFSEDGKYLIFTGTRSKAQPHSLMGSRDVFEDGSYKLDMETFKLVKVHTYAYSLPIYEENADFIWP